MDVNVFVERYSTRQDEARDGHDFWRDLVELVGSRDDYDTYVPQRPVRHVEYDRYTDEELVDSTGHVDFYSEEYGVVVELKGGEHSIASQRKEFPIGFEGNQAWNNVLESRPRKWDPDRRVTPFVQAREYADDLALEGVPVNYIVVSNFREIRIYKHEQGGRGRIIDTEEIVKLEEVPEKLHRLQFLARIDEGRVSEAEAASRHAGELMRELRGHMERCWKENDGVEAMDGERRVSANVFLLRIAFLLFAEDSFLLGNGKDATGHEFADWLDSVPYRFSRWPMPICSTSSSSGCSNCSIRRTRRGRRGRRRLASRM